MQNEKKDTKKLKKEQLDIILKNNPKNKNLNRNATRIESEKDIKTFEQAVRADETIEKTVSRGLFFLFDFLGSTKLFLKQQIGKKQ